ncbi:helix-turn-helix transcriptional regulator [Glaciecola petra]|uniref:Helix-turn-helix transcriptional regulator n=1 Tax=Glaciecola petra TaxID=3075602 RepID=A0ABU2ZVN1_9ALTE|nr:helix-turn-helix transcriptional regulator [Aestuariibacter sp. P117]MDT0596291.1 helix-turn-helix transcriptional regulator [Aestuariibacter sp. P117]
MKKIISKLRRLPVVIKYGLILSAGLIVIKTIEYQLFSFKFSVELYSSLIATFFLLVGLAVGYSLMKKQNKSSTQTELKRTEIEALTTQERAMLRGLMEGLSNQALADANYVSVNTIKTHLKSLYRKLGVSNRAQAVAKSKELKIISN